MTSRPLYRIAFFLAITFFCIGAQASRAFTLFGVNPNMYIAALPSLAFALPAFPAYALAAMLGIVLLKTIPAFEFLSLVLLAISFAVFFAVRVSPLHPLPTNMFLVAFASAALSAVLDPRFLERPLYVVELFVTLGAGAAFALLSWYARE